MKNTILSIFFVMALIANGFAVEKSGLVKKETGASYFAQNNFKAKFQDAKNVVWSNIDGYYKAAFLLNGVKKAAFFNAEGDYVATTQYVSVDKLSAELQAKLKKTYADYTLGEVLQFEVDTPEQVASSAYYTVDEPTSTYYFVSLRKADTQIVIKVTDQNSISFFKNL